MPRKNIPKNKLAHNKHLKLLLKMEKQANNVYRVLIPYIIRDILKELNKERLTKSEQMPKGWTKNVNKIEKDLSGMVDDVLSKYIGGLKWTLFGKAAGKKAEDAAKSLKIKGLSIPGIVFASYLNGIDIHNEHLYDVTGSEVNFPQGVMKASMDFIKDKSMGFADDFFGNLMKDLTNSLINIVELVNNEHLNNVLKQAHEETDLSYRGAIEEYGDANLKLPKEIVIENLMQTLENNRKNWNLLAQTQMGTASGVAAHQAMLEIYGKKDSDMKVVFLTMENESVCKVCEKWSKPDGKNYKYYKVEDFKPSGWNYGKKKVDWELCIPPTHPHCYCSLIYVPTGMEVGPNGTLKVKE